MVAGVTGVTGLALGAERELAPGHSAHGEVFNHGPRQAAVLIEGTGNVFFEVSTEKPLAQIFFNQGLGQLHGFWDFEAERSFRQVAAIDPDCAMAYWGMAMANYENEKRAKEFIAEAVARKASADARERMWIEALATYYKENDKGEMPEKKVRARQLVRNLEAMVAKYPEDVEAKAFLLVQIWRNTRAGHPISSHHAIDLIAKEIFEWQPDHPAHHYRIHLWDKEQAERALTAAAHCGPAAPGIAHMWHMPGHVYSKLKRYADAAWYQEASARIDHAHMMRYQITPDAIHNFAHNNEWLLRNLHYLGRVADAIELACNMIELPRLAKLKSGTEDYAHKGGSWSQGRLRLRDTLVGYEMWEELLAFGEGNYLQVGTDEIDEVEWNRFMGIAAYASEKDGAKHLATVTRILAAEQEKQRKAVADAREKAHKAKKKEKEIEKAKKAAKETFTRKISAQQNARDELEVFALLFGAEPKPEEACVLLWKLKGMDKSRRAQLLSLAGGDSEKVVQLAKEAVSEGPSQVLPLAIQVEVLWRAKRQREARKGFEELCEIAGRADLGLPVFKRLAAMAPGLPMNCDWRKPAPSATDLGHRPTLEDLGPLQWMPPVAPGWTLQDAEGKTISLRDYRGKPVLLIFSFGKGCAHCMEQLHAFAPMQEEYEAAGIALVAVSTNSPDDLKTTYQNTSDGTQSPFPFPLLSDPEMRVFKNYRAYDDFEKMALHGTFLIDGMGKMRWQNIGFEPFMHVKFLLSECKRLLGFDGVPALTVSGMQRSENHAPQSSDARNQRHRTPLCTRFGSDL